MRRMPARKALCSRISWLLLLWVVQHRSTTSVQRAHITSAAALPRSAPGCCARHWAAGLRPPAPGCRSPRERSAPPTPPTPPTPRSPARSPSCYDFSFFARLRLVPHATERPLRTYEPSRALTELPQRPTGLGARYRGGARGTRDARPGFGIDATVPCSSSKRASGLLALGEKIVNHRIHVKARYIDRAVAARLAQEVPHPGMAGAPLRLAEGTRRTPACAAQRTMRFAFHDAWRREGR